MPSRFGVSSDWREMGSSRRLHPLTILKELGAMAWAIVGALIFDFNLPQVPGDFIEPDTFIAVGVFAYAVVRYLFTSYELTDRTLVLRRGVLVRQVQTMPRDRIQSVGVNTGLVGRFAGVTSVEVSAADTEAINLSFVSQEDAAMLRSLLDPEASRRVATDEDDPVPPETTTLSRIDAGSLALYGVSESALLGAGIILIGAVTAMILFDAPFAPLAIVPLAGWPVVRVINLIGFHSWIENDRVKIVRGVLSRRETDAPIARVQAIAAARPLVRRLLGYETVTMATGDVTVSSDDPFTVGIVAPLVEIGRWRDVAEQLVGRVSLGETDLRRSSRLTVRRTIVRGSVITAIAAAAVATPLLILDLTLVPVPVVVVLGVLVSVLYARRRFEILGWVADEEHLMVRGGVISRYLAVVPVRKVQDVSIRATFFQHRLGIATVIVDTAGVALAGSVRAVDLDVAEARRLADHLADRAARIALPDGV